MADDLLPPRDLAKAAFAVMVWASSKRVLRDKLLTGFGIASAERERLISIAAWPGTQNCRVSPA